MGLINWINNKFNNKFNKSNDEFNIENIKEETYKWNKALDNKSEADSALINLKAEIDALLNQIKSLELKYVSHIYMNDIAKLEVGIENTWNNILYFKKYEFVYPEKIGDMKIQLEKIKDIMLAMLDNLKDSESQALNCISKEVLKSLDI